MNIFACNDFAFYKYYMWAIKSYYYYFRGDTKGKLSMSELVVCFLQFQALVHLCTGKTLHGTVIPIVIGTPLLPNNSVLIREMSFGER